MKKGRIVHLILSGKIEYAFSLPLRACVAVLPVLPAFSINPKNRCFSAHIYVPDISLGGKNGFFQKFAKVGNRATTPFKPLKNKALRLLPTLLPTSETGNRKEAFAVANLLPTCCRVRRREQERKLFLIAALIKYALHT